MSNRLGAKGRQRTFNPRTNLHSYRNKGYRHLSKDPILDEVHRAIELSGLTWTQISNRCGVSKSCLRNWELGKTRRPQHITIKFVLETCGYTTKVVPR